MKEFYDSWWSEDRHTLIKTMQAASDTIAGTAGANAV